MPCLVAINKDTSGDALNLALAYAAGNHRRWSEPEFQALAAAEQARLREEFAALTGASI